MSLNFNFPSLHEIFSSLELELSFSSEKCQEISKLLDDKNLGQLENFLLLETKKRSASYIEHQLLGNVFFERKHYLNAIKSFEKSLNLEKNNTFALTFIALAKIKIGLNLEAKAALEKVVKIQDYENIDMNSLLCEFCNSIYHWRDTVNYIDMHCAKINERLALSKFNALDGLGETDRAIRFAVEYNKKNSESEILQKKTAIAYGKLGNFPQMAENLKDEFFRNDDSEVLWHLVRNGGLSPDEENITLLSEKYIEAHESKSEKDRLRLPFLAFSLADMYGRIEHHENEFNFLSLANSCIWEQAPYDFDGERKIQERLMEISVSSSKFSIMPANAPLHNFIFIVGMPCSGTTLIEPILNECPLVYGAGELPFLNFAIRESKVLENPNAENFINFRGIYSFFFFGLNIKQRIVVDNTPLNYRYIPIIKKAFPDAHIIHCKRDTKAMLFSCFESFFSSKALNFTTNQEALNNYYKSYTDVLNFFNFKYENEIIEVNLEDLIDDPEVYLRGLFQNLNLEYDDDYLHFYNSKRSIASASSRQVRKSNIVNPNERYKLYEQWLTSLFSII